MHGKDGPKAHRTRRTRRPPAGADPSQLAVAAVRAAAHVTRYGPAHFEERDVEAGAISVGGSGVTWIDVAHAGADDFAALERMLRLHPLAVADAAHPPQRPHYSVWADFELFVLAVAHDDGLEQVSLFLGDGWLLTIREGGEDPFVAVRERVRGGVGRIREHGASWLASALVAAILDGYFEPVEALRERLEELEDAVLAGQREPHFGELHELRRRLLTMRRAVEPMREAIMRAGREDTPRWEPDARLHLREAGEDALQLIEIVEAAQGSAASLGDLYLSVIGSRTNEVVTLLTLVSTLFLPMTFLTGVWGMNFEHMPELAWRHGYLFGWSMIVLSAAALLGYFQRRGWFRQMRGPWGSTLEADSTSARRRRRRRREQGAADQ